MTQSNDVVKLFNNYDHRISCDVVNKVISLIKLTCSMVGHGEACKLDQSLSSFRGPRSIEGTSLIDLTSAREICNVLP